MYCVNFTRLFIIIVCICCISIGNKHLYHFRRLPDLCEVFLSSRHIFAIQHPVVTARKRSLGQGNVFTGVCPQGRGGSACGESAISGVEQTSHFGTKKAGGTHPTGILSCLRTFTKISEIRSSDN